MALNNPKILIIAERFYPEEFIINELAQEWMKKGFSVEVLTQVPSYPFAKVFQGYSNRLFQKTEWNGIKIWRIFTITGYRDSLFLKLLNYFSFAFLATIAALFIGKKYDKVLVYQTGPLTQAIPAIIIKKIFRKEMYIWIQDVWPDTVYAYGFKKTWLLKKTLDLFVKIIYKNCEKIFISCRGFKLKIEKYIPDAKIIYSPQWAPIALNHNQTSSSKLLKDGINFTFAGNIGKVQNLENVVRGFALVTKQDYPIRLNIIGDGSNLEALKNIVKDENIADVHFWGRRPLKEMSGWLKGSDVLIISLTDKPIFSLTVPAKFQAYLASEKPIYCIMKGDVADLVIKSKIGFVAQPNDIEGIKLGFEKFVNMPRETIELFKSNSKELLNNEFDRNKIISQMTKEIISDLNNIPL
jgi:glycosyltransferase involved in cell wall biosynthesis